MASENCQTWHARKEVQRLMQPCGAFRRPRHAIITLQEYNDGRIGKPCQLIIRSPLVDVVGADIDISRSQEALPCVRLLSAVVVHQNLNRERLRWPSAGRVSQAEMVSPEMSEVPRRGRNS